MPNLTVLLRGSCSFPSCDEKSVVAFRVVGDAVVWLELCAAHYRDHQRGELQDFPVNFPESGNSESVGIGDQT